MVETYALAYIVLLALPCPTFLHRAGVGGRKLETNSEKAAANGLRFSCDDSAFDVHS